MGQPILSRIKPGSLPNFFLHPAASSDSSLEGQILCALDVNFNWQHYWTRASVWSFEFSVGNFAASPGCMPPIPFRFGKAVLTSTSPDLAVEFPCPDTRPLLSPAPEYCVHPKPPRRLSQHRILDKSQVSPMIPPFSRYDPTKKTKREPQHLP